MVRKGKNLVEQISKTTHLPSWLIWVFIVVFLLRIPSFFEPFWYGDEMVYLTLGEALRRGLVWYRDIHDNKPPLLYLIAAISGNVFWFRAVLAGWMLATIYFFYKLAQLLFAGSEKLVKIAVWVFALLTTITLLEGNIANAEIFMIGPIILGFWLLLSEKPTTKRLFSAGLSFGFATLFKVPAAFDLGTIFILWLAAASFRKKGWQKSLQKSSFILAGFLLPILASIFYYWAVGAFDRYITAAFWQNIGYLSSWRVPLSGQSFLDRNAPFIARAAVLILISGILAYLWKKKKVSTGFLFAGTWFSFSLFAALLSQRPYPHYLLQVVPSFSLLLGIMFAGRTKEQFYPLPLLTVLGLALIFYKFGYYAVFSYYENFILWASGQRLQTDYFAGFDRRVPRTYQIASYLSRHTQPQDPIFVWGNDTAIYALTRRLPPGRYVAAYHINDFGGHEETISAARLSPPAYIVVTSGERDFPELTSLLAETYVLVQTIEDAQLYKKVVPPVKSRIYPR